MTPPKLDQRTAAILAPIGIAMLAFAFLVSPGMFIIDEFIVFSGAKALLSNGAFHVDNGWSQFLSPDQKLWLLVSGPGGLVPQYPVGSAVVGAPLLGAFGPRGLILPNVLAAIATLWVVWSFAKQHFGGGRVALVSVALLAGATFWLEYVYAIWPHSISILCVTLALSMVVNSLDRERRLAAQAATAGAAIGVGFLFRTDTILALPALGLIAILFAARPFRIGAFFTVGLAPFLALAAWANLVKFGTLNPLSYGDSTPGGGTNLATHIVPITALLLISIALVTSRLVTWRPAKRASLIGLVLVSLVLLISAVATGFAQRYVSGAWALVVDSTVIQDPRPGVRAGPGGTLLFWGCWKKALGQSMPWLGLLFLAVHTPKDQQLGRMLRLTLILAGVWSLPFFMMTWHGGMGSNMRYLLPVLPVLCALSARLLVDFAGSIPGAGRILGIGALAGAAAVALWSSFHWTHGAGAQQIFSTWLLVAIAGLALIAGLRWRGQAIVRTASLGAIGAGLAASTLFLVLDFQRAQTIRATAQSFSVATAGLPDNAVVYAPPTFMSYWTFEPRHINAMPGHWDGKGGWDGSFDSGLIAAALHRGYRVLVWPDYVTDRLRKDYGPRLTKSEIRAEGKTFFEIMPAPSGAGPS